ncbi:MAG: hypothetical protein ACTSVZ_07045 [Promethearchaeota archaeon]
MENEKSAHIVKINSALSNQPFYIKIDDRAISVDTIISEAIKNLNTVGRPLESKQLNSLYESHQLFNAGRNISKGTLYQELSKKLEDVQGKAVEIAEIDLIARHSGGL